MTQAHTVVCVLCLPTALPPPNTHTQAKKEADKAKRDAEEAERARQEAEKRAEIERRVAEANERRRCVVGARRLQHALTRVHRSIGPRCGLSVHAL
jgi:hypothetical protein